MATPFTLLVRTSWLLLAVSCVVALIVLAPAVALAGDSSGEGSVSVGITSIGSVDSPLSLEVAGGSVTVLAGEAYDFSVVPGPVQLSLSSSGSTAIVGASCVPDTITIDISSQAVDDDGESHARSVIVEVAEGRALDCEFVVASGDSNT